METHVTSPGTAKWRVVGVVVFCVAAFLLLSMGGAIVAAPITVPLMFVATRRHPSRAFRAVAASLIGATIAEVAWALTYLAIDETKPWIWLLPLVAAVAAIGALLSRTAPPRASSLAQS